MHSRRESIAIEQLDKGERFRETGLRTLVSSIASISFKKNQGYLVYARISLRARVSRCFKDVCAKLRVKCIVMRPTVIPILLYQLIINRFYKSFYILMISLL